jgi:hypothetical protein
VKLTARRRTAPISPLGGTRPERSPLQPRRHSGKLAWALFVGALVGSVAYSAVFVLASVVTTRAIAFGLLYVAIWEGLLSNLVGGVRILSIARYSLGVANAIYPDQDPPRRSGPVHVAGPRDRDHGRRPLPGHPPPEDLLPNRRPGLKATVIAVARGKRRGRANGAAQSRSAAGAGGG